MNLIIISCSLNTESRSSAMAQLAYQQLKESEHDIEHIELVDWNLPFCNGGSCYSNEQVIVLSQKIEKATGILMATPIYNYDVSAATKNILELTGKAWKEKIVGFMCAAGGSGSYMSVMPFANSLMLDFRCTIIPRFVFATSESISDEIIQDPEINKRLKELTDNFLRYSAALGVNMQSA